MLVYEAPRSPILRYTKTVVYTSDLTPVRVAVYIVGIPCISINGHIYTPSGVARAREHLRARYIMC